MSHVSKSPKKSIPKPTSSPARAKNLAPKNQIIDAECMSAGTPRPTATPRGSKRPKSTVFPNELPPRQPTANRNLYQGAEGTQYQLNKSVNRLSDRRRTTLHPENPRAPHRLDDRRPPRAYPPETAANDAPATPHRAPQPVSAAIAQVEQDAARDKRAPHTPKTPTRRTITSTSGLTNPSRKKPTQLNI